MNSNLKSVLSLLIFGLTMIALPVTSFADNTAATQVTVGDVAAPSQDLPFTLTVEHLAGIAAWLPVGSFQMTANSTADSQLIVNYKGDPFVATFTMRATFLGMHNGHESWQISVTRQDTINGRAVSAPNTSELTLDRGGPGIRLVTHGHFSSQARELRLGFLLNQ